MYCNVTTFWQEIRARYATRFFSTLYLQSILIQLLSYIHIHICMYVCIYNDTYTGIVVAKRTDQLITRGKLNLNVCHNVRGRKGFTLPSHFLLEENQKSKFEFEYMKNIFPSIIIQYDFDRWPILSTCTFFEFSWEM